MAADAPVALRVLREGRGAPVVLAHALGVDLHMWDELAAALASDHTVLRYDHRGHGGSAVPPGPYTQDQLVDDAARVIREAALGPVLFVGLSMGGMVAQGLALRHPQLLRGVVIANSVARYPEEARAAWVQRIASVERDGLAAVADATMERWFTAGFRAAQPGLVERCRQTILRGSAAGYVATCQAVAAVDWLDELPRVRVPALVIAGTQDAGAPPALGEAIARGIPRARFELLDTAHLSVAEQPRAFEQLLRRFEAGLG